MKNLRVIVVEGPENMNHKRKGPKSTRSGCLMCKPHKHQAFKHQLKAIDRRGWQQDERLANEGGRVYPIRPW